MNDSELERWAEQQEEARSVRGGMVVVAYLMLLFVLVALVALGFGAAALYAAAGM